MAFKIEMPITELQKCKLMVGTPMYGGQATGIFTRSVAELSALCASNGIGLEYHFLFNESLIPRARNYVTDAFLRSDCTHFIFIDSDIGFKAQDVIAFMAMQLSEGNNYDVLCGPYPKKCISWEKIKAAVDKGLADQNPNNLENFVGDFVFNPAGGQNAIPLNEPVEVLEAGTGFMMIKREVFEAFTKAYPQQSYKPDHVRTADFDGSREITAFFDCPIDPETKRYLSEDYMFCQWSRKIGKKVWLAPWIQLQHMGSYMFGGSLAALAQAQVSATADVESLKKTKGQ